MTDPIDFRDRLASAGALELDAETIQWLCAGFQRHRHRGMSLNAALRLDKASLRRVRDAALRDAAEVLRPGAESEWQVAVRLADAISRFETRIWPRCRSGADFPYLGPMDVALYRAFRQGVKVPSTPKMLYQLVRKANGKLVAGTAGSYSTGRVAKPRADQAEDCHCAPTKG